MSEQKKQRSLEQNKTEQDLSFMTKVVITGLVGGMFWSLIGYVAYYFSFTEISPNLILTPWALGDWKNGKLGHVVSVVLIGIISIGVALVYFAFLKKFQKIWVSIAFGLALWGLVFYVLNPMFPNLKSVAGLTKDTLITTICLYVLYSVFIGYSISFEASEQEYRRKSGLTNE